MAAASCYSEGGCDRGARVLVFGALGIENAPAVLDGVCTPSAALSPYRYGPSTENMRIVPLSMVAL
jgi:hypothetical protein